MPAVQFVLSDTIFSPSAACETVAPLVRIQRSTAYPVAPCAPFTPACATGWTKSLLSSRLYICTSLSIAPKSAAVSVTFPAASGALPLIVRFPRLPVSPRGIVNSTIGFSAVPLCSTLASVPGSPVTTLSLILGVAPVSPFLPCGMPSSSS